MSEAETTTPEAVSPESAVASMVETPPAETTSRPDNVPEKFWDTESNSVRTDDVLKSYSELEGKFGSFTGAPDAYEFNTSDDMAAKFAEHGIEIDTKDDPLYAAAVEMAKDTGMNQEGFDKLANLYLMTQLGEAEASKDYLATQMQELGENADKRIANIDAWGQKNLDPEMYESLKASVSSAAMVPIMEHLIAGTRNAPVSDSAAVAAPAVSITQLNEMQFATDEHGNRRISTDPAYKAEFRKLQHAFYGDAEDRTMVG